MSISRITLSAIIALCVALTSVPATAQVGEADQCLKVHSTACKKGGGGIYTMGFVIQNTCKRDVLVFMREQSYSAAHPEEEGYWKSFISFHMPRRNLRDPIYQGSGTTPCAKKPLWAFCAEYKPDNFKELSDDYTNHEPYMKMLVEKSTCYREIIKEPFSNDGVQFRPIDRFTAKIPDRGDNEYGIWTYDTKYMRFGYTPDTLPRPAD